MKHLLILFVCLPMLMHAQNKPLVVEGTAPAMYLVHTVQPKENYYSIGRLYNISPKEIAPFNNLKLESGLSLNQVIKVPLTASNFVQSKAADADEALVPVYHTVQEKEGLYRISVNYNKVPIESIKDWNGIKGESVANGTRLVVGYLKVKKELSALSSGATIKPVAAPVKEPVAVKEPVVAKEPVKPTVEPVKPAPTKEIPVVKEPVVVKTPVPAVKETAPVVKEPVTEPIKTTPVAVKEPVPTPVTNPTKGKDFNGGSFKPEFEKQGKNTLSDAGTAAIFKSNSGWEDGRYYCFHNSAPAGTIVKITNTNTGKSVYAKVLDVIPDIKQNNGLSVCVSNAAASELGVGEGKFDCTIGYVK